MKIKKILAALLAVLMLGSLASCANESTISETESESIVSADPGKITLSGSTSMEDLVSALGESFEKETGTIIEVQAGGSGAGIKNAQTGATDIGNCSRDLTADEKGLTEYKIAIDAIAIIVNTGNAVTNLTSEQIVKIFKGEVKNWKEVGGKDAPIIVIGREAGSGTRDGFESIMGVEDACAYTQELNETGAVASAVASDPNAIGYISLGKADSTITVLKVDDVTPQRSTVEDGTYPIKRPFLMLTNGEETQQTKDFIDFVFSDEGISITEKQGYIPCPR